MVDQKSLRCDIPGKCKFGSKIKRLFDSERADQCVLLLDVRTHLTESVERHRISIDEKALFYISLIERGTLCKNIEKCSLA